MRTLTIQMQHRSGMKAIHALQEKHAIRIVENTDVDINSPALPGRSLTLQAFKNWVKSAEAAPSVTLKAAQSQWAKQRKELLKLVIK